MENGKNNEIQLASEEEKDDFFKAANKIPKSELKELIKEIIEDEEPE